MSPALLAVALAAVALQVGAAVSSLLLAPLLARRGWACAGRRGPGEVEFVITSKATEGVMGVLREVIERVRRGFPGYRVWVVVDHDSPGLGELRLWRWELGFNLVVVPRGYRRGRYKSRAIQYFIDNYVDEDKWYVFLDDDSYPLDDRFLCELRDDVPAYNGHIYPRRGRSLLAWLADGSRYYNSITRQRLALGLLHKPVYGLHGELLIVKGWVLKRVPMASDSLAEDSLYAARLIRAGIPVGMVSTRVSILSPHSVVDFWRQRARWNLGALRDMARGLYPPSMVAGKGVDIALWLLAPLSPLFWAILAASLHGHPHGLEALALAGAGLYTLFIVNHGLVAARELGPLRGLLLVGLSIPALTLLYYLSPIYAALKAGELGRRFVIIEKSPRHDRPTEPPRESPILEAFAAPPPTGVAGLRRGLQG